MPATRMGVGGAIANAGAVTFYSSIMSMVLPGCRQYSGEVCAEPSDPAPPEVAAPFALAGLGFAILGAFIAAAETPDETEAGFSQGPESAAWVSAARTSPKKPTRLDETEAIGMAIVQLILAGIDNADEPWKLLAVDDAESRLHVEGRYAELSTMRVRTAPDDATWLTLGACYEYANDWKLTSLGTMRGCAH